MLRDILHWFNIAITTCLLLFVGTGHPVVTLASKAINFQGHQKWRGLLCIALGSHLKQVSWASRANQVSYWAPK